MRSLFLIGSLLLARVCLAENAAPNTLGDLSIEELMDITVTSVSRTEQRVSDSAAAIFVITAEDIRRLGVNSIPEILRIAPGMDVSRIDSSRWSISARGFSNLFANKLLVLIDGRSIYTPLFSGVLWEEQDTLIEDIERIEIIRGPGATVWGANAVNGVINIITKHSKDTTGTLLSGGGGNSERAFGSARVGGSDGEGWNYRAWGKYNNRDDSHAVAGGDNFDAWSSGHAGFRTDLQRTDDTALMVSGEGYYINEEIAAEFPVPSIPVRTVRAEDSFSNGGHVIAQLNHTLDTNSKLELKAYFDLTNRDDIFLDSARRTYDFELQHRVKTSARNEFSWGGGFRNSDNDLEGRSRFIQVSDHDQRISLTTAFVQDEFALIPETLVATIGTKFEQQDLTGLEVEPSARLRFTASKYETVWVAVSRATNTPAIVDDNLSLDLDSFVSEDGTPVLTTLLNNPEKPSENLTAFEIGYRRELTPSLSMDLASFANIYDDYQTTEPVGARLITDDGSPYILNEVAPLHYGTVRSYGGEAVLEWRPTKALRFSGSYSHNSIEKTQRASSLDLVGDRLEGESPKNLGLLRSLWSVTPAVQFDTTLRYVDSRPSSGISSYVDGDVRLGWSFAPKAEVSLVGQNLFENYHQENVSSGIFLIPADVSRGGYIKVTVEF